MRRHSAALILYQFVFAITSKKKKKKKVFAKSFNLLDWLCQFELV
jgi:hypothetical protein